MFYRLADVRQLIPNIRSSYVSLIKNTVKARMDGRLPKDCFYDEVRSVVIGFDEQYYTPNEWIIYYIHKLRDMPNDYKSLIPRWHNQSNYVEVWTEKNAMIGSIRPLLKEKDVRLVPFSGYSSLSFLNEGQIE